MGLYQNNAGNLSLISGRGKAEYGASTMRTGTINMTGNAGTGTWFSATVTFSEPMPDTDYLINLEVTNNAAYCLENIQFSNKTVNGFYMAAYHPTGTTATSIPVKYTAYKLYSDIEYNNILSVITPQNYNVASSYTYQNRPIKFTKSGNVVTVIIEGLVNLPAAATVIGTIPESCIMKTQSFVYDVIPSYVNGAVSAGPVFRISMNPNSGDLRIYNYLGSTFTANNIYITFSYIII